MTTYSVIKIHTNKHRIPLKEVSNTNVRIVHRYVYLVKTSGNGKAVFEEIVTKKTTTKKHPLDTCPLLM